MSVTYSKLLFPLIAFITGFVLMVFELAAARLLSPTLGSSVFLWTSVIGIVIAALSLGVWFGGYVADRRNQTSDIAWLLLLCAITICAMLAVTDAVLTWLTTAALDQRFKGILASLFLFAPTSFFIGSCGPYLAKSNVRSLTTTGQSIANLDAMNALGGIFGTFLTGFFLFSLVGTRTIFSLLVLLLVGMSWTLAPEHDTKRRAVLSVIAGLIALTMLTPVPALGIVRSIDIDTATAHYTIHQTETVRLLTAGPRGSQSGIYLDSPDRLLFWYTSEIATAVSVLPEADTILVLGGGAFTLPSYLARQYPNTHIDTVEIDPELTAIAKEYFQLPELVNLTIINQDARTYLNTTQNQYDIVIVDVYNDLNVPFTFMTDEYGASLAKRVTHDGSVFVNAIGGETGACRQLIQAVLAPYRAHYASSHIKRTPGVAGTKSANHIVYFTNQPLPTALGDAGYEPVLYDKVTPFTDDFAPVETTQFACSQS